VEFAILGPLEARADGRELALGGPKQRAVLAMRLLQANRPVSRDRLIDGLWGESPPRTAAHTLDDYVSRLRRTLGGDRIERGAAGYLTRVEPGELDLERFEALLEQRRSADAAGDAAQASDVLGKALGLWRGRALAISRTSRSPGRSRSAWRSAGSSRSKHALTPSSHSDAIATSSESSSGSSPSIRSASGSSGS
jgi:hypothetical protein